MLRITPLLFAAALLAQPAQAAVTYTWKDVDAASSMPAGLNLELVFSDAAVEKGHLALDFVNMLDNGEDGLFQQDSLLSLRYWYEPVAGGPQYNYLSYGNKALPQYYRDHIEIDVTFLPGGLLSGSIFAIDDNSDFRIESVGSLFTVIRAHSDEPVGCAADRDPCSGSTGMLVTSAQGEVPEPSSMALAGLGLFAAWGARRRKR